MELLLSVFEVIYSDILLTKIGFIILFGSIMFFMNKHYTKKLDIIVGSILSYILIMFIISFIFDLIKDSIDNDKFIKIFKDIEYRNMKTYVNGKQVVGTNIIYVLKNSEHINIDRPRPSKDAIIVEIKDEKYELIFKIRCDKKHKNVYGVYFYSKKDGKEYFHMFYRIRTDIFNKCYECGSVD